MENNVIHKFPGVYDPNLNEELYLPVKTEIISTQYTMIKTYLGVTGPGRQVVTEGSKYFLLTDEEYAAGRARIVEELAEKGQTYPDDPEPDVEE